MRGFRTALIVATCVAVVASVRAFAAGTSVELRGIELAPADGGMRITLSTSSPTSHDLFTLERPDRVVIDLRRTRLASGVRMPAGVGVVETVRAGDRPGGTLRIVLELKSDVPSRSKWFIGGGDAGNRLVVALGKNVELGAAPASVAAAENAAPRARS